MSQLLHPGLVSCPEPPHPNAPRGHVLTTDSTGRSKDVMSIGTTPKASSDLDLGGGCVVFRQPWLASNFLAGV